MRPIERTTRIAGVFLAPFLLILVMGMLGSAFATTYNLCADRTNLVMPDGVAVPVWGFGLDGAGGCEVTVPGPRLTVDPSDPTLTIVLKNNLDEPVSLHILGQRLNFAGGPVWTAGNSDVVTGSGLNRPADFTSRVRSFSHETPPGGTGSYTWENFRPGTYLLQSGTNPAKQVQMGLYAPVTMDVNPGQAYPGVAYHKELIFVFHEMDPAIHQAIQAENYGPGAVPATGGVKSSVHREPGYFLINGMAFPNDGLNPINPLNSIGQGERVLLRFLNAGLTTHVPQLLSSYMTVVAEDGNRLSFVREQYGFELPAAKTVDAILIPSAGELSLIDARLNLSNAGSAIPGGMLAKVLVETTSNIAPIADDQTVTTPQDTPKAVTLTGSDADGDALAFTVVGGPGMGALTGTAPDVVYTPNPGYIGMDQFTFKVNDGTVDSNEATVTVTVSRVNNPPLANDQTVTTPQDTAKALVLTGSDPDGDPLTYSIVGNPSHGTLSGTAPSVTYTPNAGYSGVDSFSFKVNDGLVDSNPATVSITIEAVIPPPVLHFSTVGNSAVPGVSGPYDDGDIYSWNGVGYSRIFDASAAGVPANADIDALKVIDGDTFYMSFNADGIVLPGIGAVNDEDIVLYDAGVWRMYFDGSDVGLTTTSEDIDAFEILPDGSVIVSTVGSPAVPGLTGVRDEDLMRCAGTFGPATTCAWSLYFDGSDIALTATSEDIAGTAVSAGSIYLTTSGNFSVAGLSGGADDIFVCNSPITGPATSCGSFNLFFDGRGMGLVDNIDAFDLP